MRYKRTTHEPCLREPGPAADGPEGLMAAGIRTLAAGSQSGLIAGSLRP